MKRFFGLVVVLFAFVNNAQAAPAVYTIAQGGFSEGASISGSFTGDDLDNNGQLSFFSGEVTAFNMTFSGNSVVTAFNLGFGDLTGLVYDIDGGPLGDGLLLDVEGISANNMTFSYNAGPGPEVVCGQGVDCTFVSDGESQDASQQLIVVNGSVLPPVGPGLITATPSNLSFRTPVNTTSDAKAVTVFIPAGELYQGHSITPPFAVMGNTCNAFGSTQPTPVQCALDVVAMPVVEGTASGELLINGASSNAVVSLNVDTADLTPDEIEKIVDETLNTFANGNENIESTNAVIANSCVRLSIAGDTSQFTKDCNDLVGSTGDGSGVSNALDQITPERAVKAANGSKQSGQAQVSNVGARMAALRGGAVGISVGGIALNLRGFGINGDDAVSLLRNSDETGGGASADNPLIDAGIGIWVGGNISTGDKSGSARESGFDFDTYGITAGIDKRFTEEFIAGVALGYSNVDTDLDNNGGEMEALGYSMMFYGTYYFKNNYYLDFSATKGWENFDQSRRIIYDIALATVDQTVKADYDGDSISFYIASGWNYNTGPWLLTPNASLTYLRVDVDGFTEKTSNPNGLGGGWATSIDSSDQDWFTSKIGGTASYTASMNWGVLIPQVSLDWLHEFKDDSLDITGRFASDSESDTFTIKTDDPDRDYFRVGLGLNANFANGIVAFVNYDTLLGNDRWNQYRIDFGVRKDF